MAGEEIIILGLDPGSRVTGWGLVREVSGTCSLIDTGVITINPRLNIGERMGRIHAGIAKLVARYCPHEAAFEDVFVSKNAKSSLKLGQARGAALAACGVAGVPVHSYEPTRVKKSLVGTGRADKSQVAFMVSRILGEKGPWREDASDALAVAVCHLNERRMQRLVDMA